nr:hypothetical protein [Tanacetum cinerariifolium]
EDLVPAEDEAPASLLPPGFLSPRIRPLSPKALGAEMNAISSSLRHSLHPSGHHHCFLYLHHPLAAELGFPRLIHRLEIGHYLLLLDLGVRSERVLLLLQDGQDPLWLMESIAVMTLEARVAVLETHARHLEWQHQAADDLAVQHIMRTQALEAGVRDDTLEDTGSSS